MLKGILFSPTICSLSEVGGFLDAEELHLSLCSISHSGIYGVYRARCFTHGPALYHGSPLALHPKHYATFHHSTSLVTQCCIFAMTNNMTLFDKPPTAKAKVRDLSELAGYRESTKKGGFALTPLEIWWRDRAIFLESRGYRLRPRFRPDWEPSWVSRSVNPFQCEDAQPHLVRLFHVYLCLVLTV